MNKLISSIILISLSFIVGCSGSATCDNDEVAAIVRGEEITVGDIRFLVEVEDEDLPEVVESMVRETVVIQEAKKMGIDVSDEVESSIESFGQYPPENVDTDEANEIREFAKAQAERFDMKPKEYHKEYIERSAKRSAYANEFFKEHFGDKQPETEEEAEELNDDIQQTIDALLKEHEDEIEIRIK
ncbi:Mn-dependent DtxR family transcriptional regulator [Alkalibacillus flavidus]|uniref:Mn-dependent DtxR family transcriptional regulator n=1 Tax=Alkalibacillus flavidus TaxID=546021 RepID=A0ABV2KXY5_9BACI